MDEILPIVVVSWNRPDELKSWLDSFRVLKSPRGFVKTAFIIDNASTNKAIKVIHEALKDKAVKEENVYFLPSNYGFIKAQNHIFRRILCMNKCLFIATLNEDAVADKYWLSSLVEEANKPEGRKEKVGMWGGPIYKVNEKNKRQGQTKVISSAGHCLRSGSDGAFFDIDWDSRAKYSKKEGFEPFSPCFAASLWSTEMLRQCGLPDDKQIMYYDDVEIAYRARLRGWKARYVKGAEAFHPLPRKKDPESKIGGLQEKGKITIANRFFPDEERKRVVDNYDSRHRKLLEELNEEGRDLGPVSDNNKRKKVYNEWAGKYCRRKKMARNSDVLEK